MLLCIPPIWLPNDQWDGSEDSWDRTGGDSSAPNTNMRSSEVVEEPWGIKIIDRSNGDVDDPTSAIKGFLESVVTAVFDRYLQ
jgi:hypothetical protein